MASSYTSARDAVPPRRDRADRWAGERGVFWTIAALLVVAVSLGGGGTPDPVTELAVLAASLIAAGVLVVQRPPSWRHFAHDRVAWACIGGAVALPLVQLIPVPPAIWQALPGRAQAANILELTAAGNQWRCLSLFPALTLSSLLSLLPPLVLIYGMSYLGGRARSALLGIVAVLAVLSALLGVLQYIAGENSSLHLYARTARRFATGLFANRNTLPDLLAVGAFAIMALARLRPDRFRTLRMRLAALLALATLAAATLATGSRMGIALWGLVALAGATTAVRLAAPRSRRTVALGAVAAGVLGLMAIAGALQVTALKDSGARFDDTGLGHGVSRPVIWRNTLGLIGANWPVGSGFGSFVPLYQAAEPLDEVSSAFINRAHNDWLEVALEGGLPAMMLLLALAAFVAVRARSLIAADGPEAPVAWFASQSLLLIALHSAVDYPLRNLAMLSVAALAFGMLLPGRRVDGGGVRP